MNHQTRRDQAYKRNMQEWLDLYVRLEREDAAFYAKHAHIQSDADFTPETHAAFYADADALCVAHAPFHAQCERELGSDMRQRIREDARALIALQDTKEDTPMPDQTPEQYPQEWLDVVREALEHIEETERIVKEQDTKEDTMPEQTPDTIPGAPCIYCGDFTIYYCEHCSQRMCGACVPGNDCPNCHPELFEPDMSDIPADVLAMVPAPTCIICGDVNLCSQDPALCWNCFKTLNPDKVHRPYQGESADALHDSNAVKMLAHTEACLDACERSPECTESEQRQLRDQVRMARRSLAGDAADALHDRRLTGLTWDDMLGPIEESELMKNTRDRALCDEYEAWASGEVSELSDEALATQGQGVRDYSVAYTHDTLGSSTAWFSTEQDAQAARDRWATRPGFRAIGSIVKVAALAIACLLPSHVNAQETLDFLTPPANCTLYLAFEDHSSAAYCEATGQYVVFDPGTPTGAGRGWSMSPYWYTSAR